MALNMSGKKRDIVKGCAACGKTCGGFDEIRTRFAYYLTHLYLFFIGEQAGFDDNFEYMTIKKLDPSKPEDKQLVEDYWTKLNETDEVEGRKCADVEYFN